MTEQSNKAEKNKEYHHNYYISKYKDIIKDKKAYCNICDCEISKWNIYKHNNSLKHKINSMSEEEREHYIVEKNNTKEK